MKKILANILILTVITISAFGQKLEKVWETEKEFKIPESVIYDATNDIIYVANINGSPSQKDGNGFISKLSTDGKIKKLEWVTGLNAPKGMAIYQGKLYVSDINELVEIDIDKGKILNSYERPEAKFLNDVTACFNGMIFVSDSGTGIIYVLDNGEFSLWLENPLIENPNGLLADMGKLYIGGNSIYEVNIGTKQIKKVFEEGGGIDGLEKDSDGSFVFSHWAGRIFLQKGDEKITLIDSSGDGINSADIDYALNLKLLLVPTFFDNRVIAYKIVY